MKYIIVTLLVIWALLHMVQKYTGYSVSDLLPAQEVQVHALSRAEQAHFQPRMLKIEDIIYENTPKSLSPWAMPLYADKKSVIFINWGGQHAQLLSDFKNLFRIREYNQFYRRQIYTLHGTWASWKNNSSKELFLKNCNTSAVCIFNPQAKEMLVLPKADLDHLAYFLEKYKNW